MIIKFFINGKEFETKNKFTIFDLLTYLSLISYPIAIELNGIFINKKHWNISEIKNKDEIEIVTIVGGG